MKIRINPLRVEDCGHSCYRVKERIVEAEELFFDNISQKFYCYHDYLGYHVVEAETSFLFKFGWEKEEAITEATKELSIYGQKEFDDLIKRIKNSPSYKECPIVIL